MSTLFVFKHGSRAIFALLLSLFLVTTASASANNKVPEPQRLMEETSDKMLKKFIENTPAIRKDTRVAYQLIRENLVPKINFKLMSRWVLGKNWRKATQEQRAAFTKEFKKLVIEFYSKAFVQYLQKNDLTPDIITFKPFRGKLKSKYATVRSQINPPNGAEPITVNYDLYLNKAGQWQVYDVSVEGISLVTTYRSSFKQIISQKGMDALLADLKDKNAKINQDARNKELVEKS